jgi:hypothetical protein
VSHDCSFIIGYGLASSCPNTTYMNCLNLVDIPTESALPLPVGSVYKCSTESNRLYVV